MEDIIQFLFGQPDDLNALQMCIRAFVVFFIALTLIRISGRRSFGLKAPLDNIIAILLGAILSRIVVGASPFAETILACLIITLLHRIFAFLTIRHKCVENFMKGEKILLYKEGYFIESNLKRALVSQEDIKEGVRLAISENHLENVDLIYMERNGQLSIIKKS